MQFQFDTQATQIVVTLSGAMDATGLAQMGQRLEDVIPATPTLVIHIGEVSFMDPSGIGLLVTLFRRQKAMNGSLRIEAATGQPAAMMTNLGLIGPLNVSTSDATETTAAPVSAPVPTVAGGLPIAA